jgi:uncharacterized Tic20 family protein
MNGAWTMNPHEVYSEVVDGRGRVMDPLAAQWERTYAMFTHLTLLLVHFLPVPVIPALIMWLIKRDQSPYIDDHGREAINFQLSLVLYALVVVPIAAIITCGIGAVLWLGVYALGIIGMILASVAAYRGQYYRYPATIRFLH